MALIYKFWLFTRDFLICFLNTFKNTIAFAVEQVETPLQKPCLLLYPVLLRLYYGNRQHMHFLQRIYF